MGMRIGKIGSVGEIAGSMYPNVPPDPLHVAIIGGEGKMGKLFELFFRKHATDVFLSSENSPHSSAEIAQKADIIVFSVPITVTEQVINEINPLTNEKQLLIDLTSLKKKPCDKMLESHASVIGMHPLFGPNISSFANLTMAICPVRPGKWKEWLVKIFKKERLDVLEVDPEQHDRIMAVVQCLTYFTTLSFSDAVEQSWNDHSQLKQMATPSFALFLQLMRNILDSSSELYADIAIENPYFQGVLENLQARAKFWQELIMQKDKKGFMENFERLQRSMADLRELHREDFIDPRLRRL